MLNALSARVDLTISYLPTVPAARAVWYGLRRRYPPAQQLPDPDLILGAGHATHLPMLAARRARGGRVVVLMKPSLPLAWFDLCVIPEHDSPPQADNVFPTRGVLNCIRHSVVHDDSTGLFLIGGPAPHVRWDDEHIIAQLTAVLERAPGRHWWLTTSRRTPQGMLTLLSGMTAVYGERLTIVPATEAGPEWLPEHLGLAACVWVTDDSVSMVYEALTAGVAVGLLSVPRTSDHGRVASGMERLRREKLVVSFADWEQGSALKPAEKSFDEAARCANWILEQWLTGR